MRVNSECLAEALGLALSRKSPDLAAFCKGELEGWTGENNDIDLAYRSVNAFVAIGQERPNVDYVGWKDAGDILDYMNINPKNFKPFKLLLSFPISQLESQVSKKLEPKSLLRIRIPVQSFLKDESKGTADCYASNSAYNTIVASVRQQLTKRLLALML